MLTRDTGISKIAPNYAATSSGTAFGALSVFEAISVGQQWRLQTFGTITRVAFYIANLTNITSVKVRIWRKIGPTNYWLVGQSENLLAGLTAGQVNTVTLSSPITGCREGDYTAIKITASAAISTPLVYKGSVSCTLYRIFTDATETGGYAWESQGNFSGAGHIIECYMQNPHMVGAGDSRISGLPNHLSYVDTAGTLSELSSSVLWQLRGLTTGELVYVNTGRAGKTSTEVATTFADDVIARKPRYCVIWAGTNNVAGGNKTQFLADFTAMLDACAAASPVIIPAVILIGPSTARTNADSATADDWDTALTSLVAGYPAAKLINLKPTMGQFRAGGTTGNLWDIQPKYDSLDGLHFSRDGNAEIARLVYQAFARFSTVTTPIRSQILAALAVRLATITVANGYRTNLGQHVEEWTTIPLDQNVTTYRIKYHDETEDRVQQTVGEQDMTLDITLKIETTEATPLAVMRTMIADVDEALEGPSVDKSLGGLCEDIVPAGSVKFDKAEAADTAVGAVMKYQIMYSVDKGTS